MNENIALILSLLVIATSITTVVFYKNKYNKKILLQPKAEDSKEVELLKVEFVAKITQLELTQEQTQKEKSAALAKILEQEKIIEEKSTTITNQLVSDIEKSVALAKILEQEKIIEEKSTIIANQLVSDTEKLAALAKILEQEKIIEENSTIIANQLVSDMEKSAALAKILEQEKIIEEKSTIIANQLVSDMEKSVALAKILEQEKIIEEKSTIIANQLVSDMEKSAALAKILEQEKIIEEKSTIIANQLVSDMEKSAALAKILEQEKIIEEKSTIIANQLVSDMEKSAALAKILEQEKIIEEKSVKLDNSKEERIKSILVVDDSMVVRNKMKKLLENAGYDVTTANDGLEALEALKVSPTDKDDFSLVITDLEMPNLDGFGLIMKLGSNPETKGLPVMAITGHEEIKFKVIDCGGLYSVHRKPWNDSEILRKVELLSSINTKKELEKQ